MATGDPRAYLWQNVCKLMSHAGLGDDPSIDAVQNKTRVGRGTIQRIRDGEAASRLSSLVTIAHAFKIEVWQLLTPALDPEHPPALQSAGEHWPFQSIDPALLRDLSPEQIKAIDAGLAVALSTAGVVPRKRQARSA